MPDHPFHGKWSSYLIGRMTGDVVKDDDFNLTFVSGSFNNGDHGGKKVSCPSFSNTKIKLVEDVSKREFEGEIKATLLGKRILVGTFVFPAPLDSEKRSEAAGQNDGVWVATLP